jgi:hypothetical protein
LKGFGSGIIDANDNLLDLLKQNFKGGMYLVTIHKAKIQKTGKLQAFLMPRRAWVRKSPGGIRTKNRAPPTLRPVKAVPSVFY